MIGLLLREIIQPSCGMNTKLGKINIIETKCFLAIATAGLQKLHKAASLD